jgi:hypothetical protein
MADSLAGPPFGDFRRYCRDMYLEDFDAFVAAEDSGINEEAGALFAPLMEIFEPVELMEHVNNFLLRNMHAPEVCDKTAGLADLTRDGVAG